MTTEQGLYAQAIAALQADVVSGLHRAEAGSETTPQPNTTTNTNKRGDV